MQCDLLVKEIRLDKRNAIFAFAVAFVFILSVTHNYLGVIGALSLGVLVSEFKRGMILFSGFSAAFYIISLYVLIRMALPSVTPLDIQFQEVVRFIAIGVFSTVVWKMSPKYLFFVLKIFFYISFLLVPLYLSVGLFGVVDSSGMPRYAGLMPHANHLGYVSSVTGLTFLYLIKSGCVIKPKWPVVGVLVCLLVLSWSSGGVLVFFMGLGVLYFKFKLSIKNIIGVFICVLLLGGVLLSPIGQLALEKIAVLDFDNILSKSETYNFGNQGSSLAWRISYWMAMMTAQIDSGLQAVMFGQGGGAATLGYDLYSFLDKDPHSDFIKVIVEYGVVGLFIFFVLLSRVLWLSGAGLISFVVMFGPMMTGNSLTSSIVIFILICNVRLLYFSEKLE